mmetsp:Transcript_17570/g.40487  ORF Transcript_17570/g.40487 Transcript_17570/m.40487 type:complete len:213 (-) Transcript_17570:392-1030(-)
MSGSKWSSNGPVLIRSSPGFFFLLLFFFFFLLSLVVLGGAAGGEPSAGSPPRWSSSRRRAAAARRSIPYSCPYAGWPASTRSVSYSNAPTSTGPSGLSSPTRRSQRSRPIAAAVGPGPKKTKVYPTHAADAIPVDGTTSTSTPSSMFARGFHITASDAAPGNTISSVPRGRFDCSRTAFRTCPYCVEARVKAKEDRRSSSPPPAAPSPSLMR